MNNLYEMVLSNTIVNQLTLNKYYEESTKILSTKINTKVTIFGIIEDYKKAVVLLREKNITIHDKFNKDIFNQILAKLKAIGITNWKSEISEFKIYKNYLIDEVSKRNKDTALSFSRILSDENIKLTTKDVLNLFYQGFSNYVTIAVNLHQYTKVTIIQCNRIGNTFFDDMKSKYTDYVSKNDIDKVKGFLNEIVEEILESKEYKRIVSN